MSATRRFICLPNLNVHNANALSSPFTIGFPAMTSWLGFAHALERNLRFNQSGYESLEFLSIGIVSHDFDLQTYQGLGDYVHSIVSTANPVDKDGTRPAFIEEARCHLEVSLLIEYIADEDALDLIIQPAFIDAVTGGLEKMKVAGGDLMGFKIPRLVALDESNEADTRKLLRSLMPGYALVERRNLMAEAMEQGADALDALLEFLTVHHSCDQLENGEPEWHSKRKASGWIVPIATGFHGISPLGIAKNQRDADTPHRFAESVVTLGEFVMPHRITSVNDFLWEYHTDLERNLYLCQQLQTADLA